MICWNPILQFFLKENQKQKTNPRIFISRDSEPALSGENDLLHPKEIYAGLENSLNLNMEERFKFSCSFDNIKNYPFGLQSCSLSIFIEGTDNNLTNLLPEKFKNKGPQEIGQFLIQGWRMEGKYDAVTERNIVWIQLGKYMREEITLSTSTWRRDSSFLVLLTTSRIILLDCRAAH